MAFINIKLKIPIELFLTLPFAILKNIRSTSQHKASRNRQCFKCLNKINKGDYYINHQFKYDYTIKTISFCIDCFGKK